MLTQAAVAIPAPDADLCFAFTNTRYWRGTPTPTEELRGADDLLRWAALAERLPPALLERFAAAPDLLADALALRETIYRCFAAIAHGGEPAAGDLDVLNRALADAPERRRVLRGGWETSPSRPSAAVLLAPMLWSAADLLAGAQLVRVRQCENPQCGWLFLDNSKGGNRRWCSMSACGNRAKAHRHYLRQKER